MASFHHLIQQPSFQYGDATYLAEYRFADGQGFPPSYVDFALQLGWGRLCGLFLVYVPLGNYCDSWLVRSVDIKVQFDSFCEEMEHEPFLLEPDGYPGLEAAMMPFGKSENGEYVVWDTSKRAADNELPIYVVAARMDGIRYGADNLAAFIERCTNAEAVKKMLDSGYSKLPLSFEPLPVL